MLRLYNIYINAMMFNNRYRIESNRLKGWDYSGNGCYFVTICTRDRECLFGDLADGFVRLSQVGEIARNCWENIPKHFSAARLDEFVIMPNHIHGIVVIENDDCLDDCRDVGRDVACYVSTGTGTGTGADNPMSKISPKPGSLGVIVRSYKSAVTRRCRQGGYDFFWQSRFYDHIIRDDESFNRVREYIINNPIKWELDKNNPVNLQM